MEGGIFVAQGDGRMSLLRKGSYDAEEILQKLLADYPALLAGEQIDPEEPRRWLLIAREFPVPDPEDGAARWSLDHLFVDQEAIPTLVEVKRSSDTRIRREVIAQMLDYAANSALWRVEDLIGAFQQTCDDDGVPAEEKLTEFLAGERTPEDFWQSVKANLGSARLRLLFVADEIPVQLQSIVEFLNNQMNSTQVLAIAIPQYVGEDGLTAYVPRLLGQTAQGQLRRSISGSAAAPPWSRLDGDGVASCLELISGNPHVPSSRRELQGFVEAFAGMAMRLQDTRMAQVLYRPIAERGAFAAIRVAVSIGSKTVRVVHCACSPKEKSGVSLLWGFRELATSSEDDPALLSAIGGLRDTMYASIGSQEDRDFIREKVEGDRHRDEWTPLAWFPQAKRKDVIEAVRKFCESIGGAPAD